MNKILILLFCTIASINAIKLSAQDKPDGFASVEGNGLTTTTGGEGGETVLVKNLSDLITYAGSSKPYIIVVNGLIETSAWRQVTVTSNKTIVGYGNDATLKNIELHLIEVENVIIRNLTIRDSYVEGDWDGKTNDYDGIQADYSHHLWIDHCHFTHCGDGLIDLRKACDNITISWVHLSNHNKAFGIGWTEETDWRMTIHHCWFDNTAQRNPSFDMGIGHLYNNYLNNISSYGNLSRGDARIVVQNSYFYKVSSPIKYQDNGKLYSEGNKLVQCSGSTTGNVSEMPFNPGSYYSYTLDTVTQIPEIVSEGAGPQAYIGDQYVSSFTKHSLTFTIEGNGAVKPDNGDFIEGANITLTATPNEGWLFDRWGGDLSGNSADTTILIDRDKIIYATFIEDTSTLANEVFNENLLSYSFNPEGKTLSVKANNTHDLILKIYSYDGKMEFSGEYINPGNLEISLNGLQSRVYFVRFEFDGKLKTGRILLF